VRPVGDRQDRPLDVARLSHRNPPCQQAIKLISRPSPAWGRGASPLQGESRPSRTVRVAASCSCTLRRDLQQLTRRPRSRSGGKDRLWVTVRTP
jgi:hypothetical protein